MKTQNELILEHLSKGNTLTSLEALEMFGCFRLASRISDLRRLGNNISSETVTKDRKSFSSYRMEYENA